MTFYAANHALNSLLGEETSAPALVGILNLTPDSFSGDGILEPERAVKRADELAAGGAAIIDVGGESTRPDAEPVSLEEELRRVEPVLRELCPRFVVSIDTYKAAVARRAIELGAKMINDVSGLRADPAIASVAAESGVPIVIMHSKEAAGHPHATQAERHYNDVVLEIAAFLKERIAFALEQGISSQQIIIDPGMGKFVSHDPKYSFDLIERLNEFPSHGLPYPIMIGLSRKGFLGGSADERLASSLKWEALAAANGAQLIRTHHPAALSAILRNQGRPG